MSPQENVLNHRAISGRYLFPQSRRIKAPFIVPVDGCELACYCRIQDPNRLTLVHFHGNGEAVADYIPWMADACEKLGLNSLFVEYRQYGESTGQAQLAAMLSDGAAVVAAAGLAPEKIVAFGRSIGSLYAIELVHRHPEIAGLILESGIAEPAERFLTYADLDGSGLTANDVLEASHKNFNHQQKLADYKNPLLILHTEHDGLVDVSHAERNYRWSGSVDKQLLRFSAGNHNTILEQNEFEYFRAIENFVNSQLRSRSQNGDQLTGEPSS